MTKSRVRVRFAPSPTGPLHIGGVRTALFNYLFAKKHDGDFILRIEDTDQKRYVEGAEQYIIESLKWCGLNFDESIEKGGNYGPYRQSERRDIYKKYALQLIDNGDAYYAFDTPEELETMRERLQDSKSSVQQYNAHTRMDMKNSLTLDSVQVQEYLDTDEPFVIRYKMPEDEIIEVYDTIRGKVKVNTRELDDKVLFKSDGMPTYHLANIVDDRLMEISHVIRGEEWLPSLPLHVMLYRSMGWGDRIPEFAHLPLLLKPTGKGKLSKRDGDKMGFPVFPLQWTDPKTGEVSSGYRESGYFPDAFVNLLALLGWNPGTEQEIFSMDELIAAFDLQKVGKSGSKFDPEKAKWFNQHYLRKKDDATLAKLFMSELDKKGIGADIAKVEKIVPLIKERSVFVQDFWEQAHFFFQAPNDYDAKIVKKRWKEDTPDHMRQVIDLLEKDAHFIASELETSVKQHIQDNELNMGAVMNALRLALVGESKGPHIFDILEILGKTESIHRIETAIEKLSN